MRGRMRMKNYGSGAGLRGVLRNDVLNRDVVDVIAGKHNYIQCRALQLSQDMGGMGMFRDMHEVYMLEIEGGLR